MEMIHTCRRISCAAIVTAPRLVTMEVAYTMTAMDVMLRSDKEKPLCTHTHTSPVCVVYSYTVTAMDVMLHSDRENPLCTQTRPVCVVCRISVRCCCLWDAAAPLSHLQSAQLPLQTSTQAACAAMPPTIGAHHCRLLEPFATCTWAMHCVNT